MEAMAAMTDEGWLEDSSRWLTERGEMRGKRQVFHPVRVALSGAERSPDPVTLMQVLGRTESERRIAESLKVL